MRIIFAVFVHGFVHVVVIVQDLVIVLQCFQPLCWEKQLSWDTKVYNTSNIILFNAKNLVIRYNICVTHTMHNTILLRYICILSTLNNDGVLSQMPSCLSWFLVWSATPSLIPSGVGYLRLCFPTFPRLAWSMYLRQSSPQYHRKSLCTSSGCCKALISLKF